MKLFKQFAQAIINCHTITIESDDIGFALNEYICMHCYRRALTERDIRHTKECIVAKAKEYLKDN